MCGIVGELSFQNPVEGALIQRMCDALAHRGPDSSGLYINDKIGLGHRRLAIIDLSSSGHQPMHDRTGRYSITFNGEIYNYSELKIELEKIGSVFQSQSDTEVILEAYKHWGSKCLTRFNGMFAFGIWDKLDQSLFLARDRLGKKPLFFAFMADRVLFASEIKALLAHPACPRQVNPVALVQFITLGYLPTSTCIINGIEKLPAGEALCISHKGRVQERYWNLLSSFRKKRRFSSIDHAAEEFLELFDDSVRLRLISDVPVGAFLSGGLDSSSVAASIQKLRPHSEILTFSAGFPQASFSELDQAKAVADHLATKHQSQMISGAITTDLAAIVHYCDEPFADTSMIPMYYLAQMTRKYVTVALSGDGADEILGGYETYIADKIHRYLSPFPSSLFRAGSRAYQAMTRRSFDKVSLDYKIIQLLKGLDLPARRAHLSWRELFTQVELKELFKPAYSDLVVQSDPNPILEKLAQGIEGCHFLDQVMYLDIRTWLVDDILVKVDRTTMAHGLEARAPFLDYRLVEFSASLPVKYKIQGFQKKVVLKRSQLKSARLTEAIVSRPKQGFNAPIAHWLLEGMGQMFDQLLESSVLLQFLKVERLAKMIQDHRDRKADHSFRLYSLLVLHLWFEEFSKRYNVHFQAQP